MYVVNLLLRDNSKRQYFSNFANDYLHAPIPHADIPHNDYSYAFLMLIFYNFIIQVIR